MADAAVVGVLIAMSVLPPLLFALWIRGHERLHREPLGIVLRSFVFGGTIGIVVAFVLNTLFGTALAFYSRLDLSATFLTAVMVAPFIEEATKGLGLTTTKRHLDEWEDGIVYGAAIGLGFAATENLIYGFQALAEGVDVAVITLVLRTFSSTVLHAGTTALLGFGYGYLRLRNQVVFHLLPYYLLAVLLHALYNFLVSLGGLEVFGVGVQLAGFAFAIAIVWIVLGAMRKRIRRLEALPHEQRAVARAP